MSNKKLIAINLIVAGLLIYGWWMISNWGTWKADNSLGMQFVAVMGLTVVIGILFVLFVLPTIGESIGAFFYSAPDKLEQDAFSKAAAKVTQGDYEGAITAYRQIAVDEPENRFPIVEIAKIQQDQFGDVDGAINTLEDAVEAKDWEMDDAAFLLFRIQELYLREKEDSGRARELLKLVMDRFPDTRHSANALHKLHEMDAIG